MLQETMYLSLKSMLSDVVPDVELRYKADLAVQINQLKKEKNAIILGHNYMEPVLFYSIPDFKGDSLDLSRKAAQTDKDVIVFCGVKFMAETAEFAEKNLENCSRHEMPEQSWHQLRPWAKTFKPGMNRINRIFKPSEPGFLRK